VLLPCLPQKQARSGENDQGDDSLRIHEVRSEKMGEDEIKSRVMPSFKGFLCAFRVLMPLDTIAFVAFVFPGAPDHTRLRTTDGSKRAV
jgi:hypothetical protein